MWCKLKTKRAHMEVEAFALGNHMIYPILFAAAVGEYYGLSAEEIRQGVADFSPTKMRMNIIHRDRNITILDDSYNANPQSMRAALEVLSGARGEYKIAVLGDMLELGVLAPTLHEGIGLYLARAGIDSLVAVGQMAAYIAAGARSAGMEQVFHCETKEEALPILEQLVKDQSTILVKASRGMQMEQITEHLKSITEEA
jgi:UDP-N-acetylmuramoyl-tripeptide--D-alanyl-D-alanine ligase